jgi:hypothetical protein
MLRKSGLCVPPFGARGQRRRARNLFERGGGLGVDAGLVEEPGPFGGTELVDRAHRDGNMGCSSVQRVAGISLERHGDLAGAGGSTGQLSSLPSE